MNQIKTITFAGAFGIVALACGWAAPASAQLDPGMIVAVGGAAGITDGTREAAVREHYNQFLGRDTGAGTGTTGELLPAVMPAGQKAATDGTRVGDGEGRADLVAGAYGDVLGRDTSGGENGLIGLLNQEATGSKAGDVSMDRMPTDQTGSDGKAELIVGAGNGGENGLIGLLRPQDVATDQLPAVQKDINFVPAVQKDINFLPAVQKDINFLPAVQKGGSLGSLNSVGSIGDLFALGRPGAGGGSDTALLPAVRPGSDKSLNFSNVDALKGQNVAQTGGAVQGGGPHVNPGAPKSINFSNAGGQAGGGQINAGAIKGLNFTNTARR